MTLQHFGIDQISKQIEHRVLSFRGYYGGSTERESISKVSLRKWEELKETHLRIRGAIDDDDYSGARYEMRKYGRLLWTVFAQPIPRKASYAFNDLFPKNDYVLFHLDRYTRHLAWELLRLDKKWLYSRIAIGRIVRVNADSDITSLSPSQTIRRKPTALVVGIDYRNSGQCLDYPVEEAESVSEKLGAMGFKVTLLINSKATKTSILRSISNHDVFHFSGHGSYGENPHGYDGEILAYGGRSISGMEIQNQIAPRHSLRPFTPTMVYINACESGKAKKKASPDLLSGGLGDAFLRAGVSCFIGPQWPIDDSLSFSFSKRFYAKLKLENPMGRCLMEAKASMSNDDRSRITSSAYVLYGNPTYMLRV